MYENVYKAVCEADYTNINLGKLHPEFYEYGRYLIPFDSTNLIGRILFQTLCHRVQHLLDSSKTIFKAHSTQNKMDRLEGQLLDMGIRTYKLFLDWYQFNFIKIESSALVADHKRKRDISDEFGASKSLKRIYGS
ncbi:GINS3 family protein [Megaselia abdita]